MICRDHVHSSRWRRLNGLLFALVVPAVLYAQPPGLTRLPMPPNSVVDRPDAVTDADQIWRLPPIEPNSYHLAEIEQIALANNPSIARAAAELQSVQGDWLQNGLYPNPKVGLGQQQTGSRGRAEQDNVTFSQEVVLGSKLRLNRAVASNALSQARHQLSAQQLRVLTDARIAFYQVYFAQRQRQLASELVRIAQAGVEAARQRNKGSDVGENDVLEARIELHKAEIEARKVGNRHAATWQSLSAVIGVRDFPHRELAGGFEHDPRVRDWPETLNMILGTSPEVAAALAYLERSKANLDRASVEKVPNVTFDGIVNWRDNGIDGKPNGGFLVSLPVPVWDRNQGGVLRARNEVAAAQRAIEQLAFDLQNRIAPVFERYANSRFQVHQYRELIIPSAARALELTRKNYESGTVEYDDLLTSQRTNAQVNIDYLEALREYWIADAELQGMALTGSLAGGSN